MVRKNRMFAGAAAAAALLASTVGALAMPSDYCSAYANSAVHEFYRAIDNPSCPGRVHGLRWHADYEMHYSWCLQAPYAATTGEWQARRNFLQQCGY